MTGCPGSCHCAARKSRVALPLESWWVPALLIMLSACIVRADAMNPDEKLLFANGLYRRGLYDLAVPEYEALINNESATNMHDLAAFRLGECLRALKRMDEASAAYDSVAENYPASTFAPRAAFRRAEIDWSAGRLKDGVARFEKVLTMSPPKDIESASLYYLALCQAGIDRYEDAEKNFRKLLKAHGSSPYADYARMDLAALVQKKKGGEQEAFDLYRTVADEPETRTLGAEASARAGLLAYQMQDMAEAVRLFSSLAERYAGDEWIVRTRLEAAWACLLNGQIDQARAYAVEGRSAATTTDLPVWLYLRANIERRAADLSKAMSLYDELLQTAPEHELAASAAYEACGIAYQQSEFERVLSLAPKAAGAAERELALLWMQAGALKYLDRKEEAAGMYQRIVQDYPDSDRAPAAAYQLGLLAEQSDNLAEAARIFADVASTYKGSPVAADALMASAAADIRIGKPEEAIVAWRTLRSEYAAYPSLDEACIGLARAEIETGRMGDATATLQGMIDSFKDSRYLAEAHYLRGTMYEQDGDYEEAEFHYQRALKLKPSPALVRQVQHRRVAVLQRQGKNDEAAKLMNKLLASGDGDQLPPPLLEWLARWNLEKKAYAEARKAAMLLAENGDLPGWRQIGSFIAGTAARALHKDDEAAEAFRSAAAYGLNTRETAESFYRLGEIALERKNPEEAIRQFSLAAENASSDTVMDIRARSYLQLGVANEALEKWTEAGRYYLSCGVLFDDPEVTPESLYRAAGVLQAQMKETERRKVIDELRDRFPDSEWTKRAGERWP